MTGTLSLRGGSVARDNEAWRAPKRQWHWALMLATLFAAEACNHGDAKTMVGSTDDRGLTRLSDVSATEWERLAHRRIFFGHQSVGGNLIDGVQRVLAENPQIGLRVVEAANPADVQGPALVHAKIGRNTDPASKNAAFVAALGSADAPDIALYKFCYLDVGAATDPDSLFAEYVRTVDRAKAAYPALTVVHVTLPLTTGTPAGPFKALVKRVLGRSPSLEAENNVKRGHYNDLLRARYAGRAPIFDLARIESTRPDGSRAYIMRGADTIYTLAPELTTDGGHLNPLAQRLAAEQFLVLLARL